MRAAFTDAEGPALWRRLAYLVPFLALVLAVNLEGGAALLVAVAAVLAFHVLTLVGFRQRTPRVTEATCGPGYVDVKNGGTRSQRIHAKDVCGGTTARTPTGVLLTLQHKRRDQPITLELATEAEAEQLRLALGIGHAGFGTVAWRTLSDGTQKAALVGRFAAGGLALLTLVLSLVSTDAGGVAALILGNFGTIGAILGIIGLISPRPEPSIIMAAGGLRLKTPAGWFALPFDAIQNVEERAGSIVFTVPPPYTTVSVEKVSAFRDGLSAVDMTSLLAHILAAAQRARGLGPQKNDVTGRIDVLRRNGESPRDWLVRLDMAGQMLSAGPGYRGHTLEVDDLWSILEDPDAEADLRAAAARVLRHAPNTRVRIDAAVAAVRDEPTNQRLRIAIEDDLDAASQELANLDAVQHLRGRLMQR